MFKNMFKKKEVEASPLPAVSPETIKGEGQIEDSVARFINFYSALEAIALGRKVTKEEWGNKDEYGFLEDEKLCIKLKEGERYWILSLGDITGEDYIVL